MEEDKQETADKQEEKKEAKEPSKAGSDKDSQVSAEAKEMLVTKKQIVG